MILGPVEEGFRTMLTGLGLDAPIRWPNENWPDDVRVSAGNMPVDDDGAPRLAIEVEVIGGTDGASIAPAGQRQARATGLFRLYLSTAKGVGSDEITQLADRISATFQRVTVFADPDVAQRLWTMDPRIDDDVASYVEDNRFVRQISIPFEFQYIA